MISLVKATIVCQFCPRKFHQIDSTEERAVSIVQGALAKHIATEHPAAKGGEPE